MKSAVSCMRKLCLPVAVFVFVAVLGGVAETSLGASVECLRWNAPGADKIWDAFERSPEKFVKRLEIGGLESGGGTQAEGQLEAFGTRYMPNAYAQYQEVRAKALELQQLVNETFPKGKKSDSTGGTMFEKATRKLLTANLCSFQRRDELCFFLLFHQAGIFSDDDLAEYDSRPICIQLAALSENWPDNTPKANIALSAEDATFAAKYLPETHAGYQRLCGMVDDGAKQYGELRMTALALGAPRARREFTMLKKRLEEIQATLLGYKKAISTQRLEHVFGETTAESLAAADQANAVKMQKYEQTMGVKTYVERVAKGNFVALLGGGVIEMVWCPPGPGMTKGFLIGKYEVTQAQWEAVMGNNPSSFKGADRPVECVSWIDCQEFCKKVGMRLPTEKEWEYACRAGSTGDYCKLADGTKITQKTLGKVAWYEDNSDGQTHPVGQKLPNAFGLYDMHGNVCEWTSSSGGYPSVHRGGGWQYGACTSKGYRDWGGPDCRIDDLGFRLAAAGR